jgi:hypothetical protein
MPPTTRSSASARTRPRPLLLSGPPSTANGSPSSPPPRSSTPTWPRPGRPRRRNPAWPRPIRRRRSSPPAKRPARPQTPSSSISIGEPRVTTAPTRSKNRWPRPWSKPEPTSSWVPTPTSNWVPATSARLSSTTDSAIWPSTTPGRRRPTAVLWSSPSPAGTSTRSPGARPSSTRDCPSPSRGPRPPPPSPGGTDSAVAPTCRPSPEPAPPRRQ